MSQLQYWGLVCVCVWGGGGGMCPSYSVGALCVGGGGACVPVTVLGHCVLGWVGVHVSQLQCWGIVCWGGGGVACMCPSYSVGALCVGVGGCMCPSYSVGALCVFGGGGGGGTCPSLSVGAVGGGGGCMCPCLNVRAFCGGGEGVHVSQL